MKRTRIVNFLLLLLAIGSWNTDVAFADLVSLDDPTYGPSSITLDTASGLEWLDVPLTTNLSFNQVSSQLGSGGSLEGFRYATITEATTLFTNAGIPHISFGPGTLNPANYAPVLALMDMVGITINANPNFQTFGLLGDPSPFVPANKAIAVLQALDDPIADLVGSADPVQASAPPEGATEITGSFLVRGISIGSLRAIVESLGLSTRLEESLLQALDEIDELIVSGRTNAADLRLAILIQRVELLESLGVLDPASADLFVSAIEALRNTL